MNAPKIKYALCVALSALQPSYQAIYGSDGKPSSGSRPMSLPIDSSFYSLDNTQLRLVDRAYCESDTSLRQIIPYILCIDDDYRVFTYSRGGAGGEGRLIGNLSIGLGGHMDEAIPAATNFATWLSIEGNRELAEEAGLPEQTLSFTHLLADTNEVGCVHCGVVAIRYVSAAEKAAINPEAGQIDNSEWLTIAELEKVQERLEGWSKLALPLAKAYIDQVESNDRLRAAQATIGVTESGVMLRGSAAEIAARGTDAHPNSVANLLGGSAGTATTDFGANMTDAEHQDVARDLADEAPVDDEPEDEGV